MRLGIIRLGNSWSINYRMNQMWMLISYKPWMFLQSEKACLVSWKTDYIHRKEIWPMAFKVTIFETHRKLGTWRFLPKISVKMLSTSKEVCWPNKSPVVMRTVIMRSDNLQRDQMQVEMWPMVGTLLVSIFSLWEGVRIQRLAKTTTDHEKVKFPAAVMFSKGRQHEMSQVRKLGLVAQKSDVCMTCVVGKCRARAADGRNRT